MCISSARLLVSSGKPLADRTYRTYMSYRYHGIAAEKYRKSFLPPSGGNVPQRSLRVVIACAKMYLRAGTLKIQHNRSLFQFFLIIFSKNHIADLILCRNDLLL